MVKDFSLKTNCNSGI